ncbi:MAG: hypothetical protein K0R22_697 [Sporomusa sp.]|nr:hypothetical protein [Sporomusa sp.]
MLSENKKFNRLFSPRPVSNVNSEKHVAIKGFDSYATGQDTLRIDCGGGVHDDWGRHGNASTAATCRRF